MNDTKLKWILTASLTLNLLLAGFFIGEAAHHIRPPSGPAMPADAAPAVQNVIADLERSRGDMFKTIDAKRDELDAILSADTFDAAAFAAKSKELDAVFTASKAQTVTRIEDAAAKLSPDDRRALARYLHRPHGGGPRCDGRGGGNGRGSDQSGAGPRRGQGPVPTQDSAKPN